MTEWRRQAVYLQFRVGELQIFSLRKMLAVRHLDYRTLASGMIPTVPPGPVLPATVGSLVRSQPVVGVQKRLLFEGRQLRYIPYQYRRYYIDLTGAFAAYLQKFSAKSRSTLKRKVRRFGEQAGGSITWRVYKTPQELQEFYELARRVSCRTYQEAMFDMGLPEQPAFREHMLTAAARDEVRAYLLFLSDQPVSYLYCPIRERVVEYAHLGYLPEHAELSPGTVLLYLALESLFAEARWEGFDFGEAAREGGHKSFFATGYWQCADVYRLRPTPGNIAAVCAHWAVTQTADGIGEMLQRSGLKPRVKRMLRALKGHGSQAPRT